MLHTPNMDNINIFIVTTDIPHDLHVIPRCITKET